MNGAGSVNGSGRARIGRYELLEPIGAADVIRARDPHLSRDVVLRRLRSADAEPGDNGVAPVLEAARALGQLSHPNVVAAYDVVSCGAERFIALERADGTPLDGWLSQRRRRAEISRVLVAAGRGLAAAHAAGVLHGNFSPASVVISAGGRVRVVDFALQDCAAPAGAQRSAAGECAYVAPERRRGQPADFRSDQFAYAATVYFALTRREPDPDTLGDARPPWPRDVSRRLRRIVERGLRARPEERHASLGAMVSLLERAQAARERYLRASAVICAMASVGAGGLFVSQRRAEAPCQLDDSVFDGVWDGARRGTLEQAFRRTGRGNAAEVFGLSAQRLDTFQRQWLGLRRQSCEATHVQREQPERVMALRAACLDRALAATKTFIGALDGIEGAGIDKIAGAFPTSLDACSDTAALLGAADSLPADAALRGDIEQIERELSEAQALLSAARGPAAIERARELLPKAERTGHAPIIAKVNAQLARATYATAPTNEQRLRGEAMLQDSLVLAARAGDTSLVARTVSYLFTMIGFGQSRIAEAEAMLPMVEALVARGGNRPEQRIEVLLGLSEIQKMHAQYPEAIATLDEVSRLAQTIQSELRNNEIYAAMNQGHIYSELGRHEQAVAAQERATDGIRRAYGAGHPRLIVGLINLARTQARAKDLNAALATMDDAHRLEATLPSTEPRLQHIPFAEADVWRYLGDCTRAIPFYRDALARFTASSGADHSNTLAVAYYLGVCLHQTKQLEEAIDVLERTLSARRRAGDTPTAMAEAAFELAQVHWLVGQAERATSLASEAVALWRRDGGTKQANQADAWIAERHQTASTPSVAHAGGLQSGSRHD